MDNLDSNPRTRELKAVSEDDLLAQQEEFIAQQRRPAANVTRVARRGPPDGTAASPVGFSGPSTSRGPIPTAPSASSDMHHFEGARAGAGAGAGACETSNAVGAPPGGGGIRGEDPRTANTEEDLLRMQEEFLAQHSRPAAKVTRITRKGAAVASSAAATGRGGEAAGSGPGASTTAPRPELAAAAPSGLPQGAPQRPPGQPSAAAAGAMSAAERRGGSSAAGPKPHNAASGGGAGAAGSASTRAPAGKQQQPKLPEPKPEAEPRSILAPIEGLLGDVVERPPVAPAAVVSEPAAAALRDVVAPYPHLQAPGAGSAAAPFPQATHRRQSKFALSRKAKQQQQQQPGNGASADPSDGSSLLPFGAGPGPSAAAAAITSATLSSWSVLPSAPTPGAAAGAASGGGAAGEAGGEMGDIAARNLEAVAAMRPEEVAAALDELSSRMSPDVMDFLKRRGAQRLGQRQQQQQQPQQPPPQPPPQQQQPRTVRGEARVVEVRQVAPGGGIPSGADGGDRRLAAAAAGLGGGGIGGGGLCGLGMGCTGAEPASCVTQEDGNALIDGALRALTGDTGAAGGPPPPPLPASVAAAGNAVGSLSVSALAAAAAQHLQQQQQQQQQQSQAAVQGGAGEGQGAAGGGPGSGPTRGSPADPRLVARLRFDVDGAVVDVQGPDEVFVEEEVLLRDQLRRDEGSVPPGYTLGELLVLCRSAVAAQRVAGLITIADLLATARPRAEDLPMERQPGGRAEREAEVEAEAEVEVEEAWVPGQLLRRFVSIPEHLTDSTPACSVSWQEVWQFFVSELGLVAHLRLALDDDRPAVLAAAATAMAAALARSESELLAAEMADLCPGTGWPAPPSGYLTRPGITAPWEAQPPTQQPLAGPGGAVAAAAAASGDEPDPPEDVALVDPLAGALQMGLLQRIRYVLASGYAPGAVLPLLAVLCAAARAGSETALAIAREPGLLAAVGALLDPAAAVASEAASAPVSGPAAAAHSDGEAADAAAAAAVAAAAGTRRSGREGGRGQLAGAVQVAALTLVRLLCSASSVVAQLVRSAGLLARTQAYILLASPAAASAAASAATPRQQQQRQQQRQQLSEARLMLQLLRLEALRAWRACAHHGIALASFDDMYGNLCHLMLPPLGDPTAAAPAPAAAAVEQLTTVEVYLLLASLVRHSLAVAAGDATIGCSMLGPGAAAAIAAEALKWLQPAALRGVAAAAVARCNLSVPLLSSAGNLLPQAAGPGPGAGPSGGLLRTLLCVHPALLLPPAAAHVACLAAVASFLATYWSTVPATQPVFGAVRVAVEASGLLEVALELEVGQQQPASMEAVAAAVPPLALSMSPTGALAMELLRQRPAGGDGVSGDPAVAVMEPGLGAGWDLDEQKRSGGGAGVGQSPEAGGAGGGGPEAHVGRAITSWALALVSGRALEGAAAASAGSSSGGGGGRGGGGGGGGGGRGGCGRGPGRLGALVQGCLQVAAASLLYGTLQLTSAVHRDESSATAAAAAATAALPAGPLAAAVVLSAAPSCCQAAAAVPAAIGRVLCPWHVAALQRRLHITRLLFLAGTLLPPSCFSAAPTTPAAATSAAARAGEDDEAPAKEVPAPAGAGDGDGDGDQSDLGAVGGDRGNAGGGAVGGVSDDAPTRQRQEVRVRWWLLEGCLASLSSAPPGAEGLCLQALRLALRGPMLEHPLQAGHAAAAALRGANPRLALAAAGVPYNAADGDATAAAPFPLPQAAPDAAEAAEVLFESYAASWLSLISQRRLAGGGGAAAEGCAGVGSDLPPAAPHPPLPRVDPLELTPVSLQGQRGSRLPAPGQWAMLEAHRLPQPRRPQQKHQKQQDQPQPQQDAERQPQQQRQQAAGRPRVGLHPVGCALLLCLGREACEGGGGGEGGGRGADRGAGVGVGGALRWLSEGTKLQAALQAAYLFRAGEMVPQDADEASEGSWREPAVRWALAGLSQRYLYGAASGQPRPPGPPGPDWLPAALAERLVAALLSTCFGDPLLGAHLALALAREASPVVRLQVWNGLAVEKSLHLLPPLSRCLGASSLYLGPAAASSSSSTSGSQGPAAPAGDIAADPDPDPALLAAVQRSLIEGDLDRALLPPPAAAPPPAASSSAPHSTAAVGSGGGPLACASIAGDLALYLLGSNLLRRDRWPAVERASKRAGAEPASRPHGRAQRGDADGEQPSGPGGGGGGGVPAAAAMLAGLVRSARPEVVAQVLVFAEARCGVRREDAAAVAAQTCAGGDVELRERVRRVLALCGLV